METLYRLFIMFEKNYELIKFHVNWADELDINSFSIKPEGYLKELFGLQSQLFERYPEFTVYVGSNQEITFTEIEVPGSGNPSLEDSLYSQPLNSEEKLVFDKFFKSEKFGYDFLYCLEDYLIDSLDIDSVTSEEYPVFYSLIKEMIQ